MTQSGKSSTLIYQNRSFLQDQANHTTVSNVSTVSQRVVQHHFSFLPYKLDLFYNSHTAGNIPHHIDLGVLKRVTVSDLHLR